MLFSVLCCVGGGGYSAERKPGLPLLPDHAGAASVCACYLCGVVDILLYQHGVLLRDALLVRQVRECIRRHMAGDTHLTGRVIFDFCGGCVYV